MSLKKGKKSKRWLAWLVIIIVLAALLLSWQLFLSGRQGNPLANIRTAKSTTGSIEKTVTGTGSLKAQEENEEITAADGYLIDEIRVEPGDIIRVGDILATFDPDLLQTAIWDAQATLDSIDVRLNQLAGQTGSQYISTAVAGRIKQVFIAEGDDIQAIMARYGALMVLSLDGKLQVTVPVPAGTPLAPGDTVTVTLSGGDTTEGTVSQLTAGNVIITFSDRQATVGGQAGISTDGKTLGSGTISISQPLAITATGGTAGELLHDLDDYVNSGTRLVKLADAPVSQAFLELYAQRLDQAGKLSELLRYQQDGALLADIDGEIRKVSLVAGNSGGSATAAAGGNAAVFTVMTASDLQLTVNVDELDIALLAPGQPAKVTIDALPGLILDGTILDIADSGTAGQNGATFAVELELQDESRLKAGMTSTAVITVDRRENIVMIPLEALQESGGEQYVYTGTAVSAFEPGEKRLVQTGISDGESVEIISGLAAGESINYYFATGDENLNPFQGGNFGRPRATTAD